MKQTATSTEVLRIEHRVIERAVLAFAGIVTELESGKALDRNRVFELAQSFKGYVERCHHAKEDFLLAMLRARAGASAEYPIRTFYEEHQHLQTLLAKLAKAAHDYLHMLHGTPDQLVSAFRGVVDFYPGHMWKADHLLLPFADQLLSEADQSVLVDQFEWIQSVVGGDIGEELKAIVSEFTPAEPQVA